MKLEFPARCIKCQQVMDPGTDAEYLRDGATYSHWHADACPEPTRRRKKRFEFRCCPDPVCYAGGTGWAFREGSAPPRCHICGRPWLVDEADLGMAA